MANAQRTAFGGMLDEPEGLHPLFWASKLHFYIYEQSVLQFPLHLRLPLRQRGVRSCQAGGSGLCAGLPRLLADTGSLSTEDVAKKHLGVDLTRRDFWDAATARILADVRPFVEQAG